MSTSSQGLMSSNAKLLRQFSLLPATAQSKLLAELRASIERDEARQKLYTYYPDTGPLRRELYAKHTEFYAAGAIHAERAFIGANRSGKSFALCYEAACHLIGWYPHWWQGFRWSRPITCWASGEDAKAVRESMQMTLLGAGGETGTGLIPGDAIGETRTRSGIPDAVDFAEIKHSSGGMSRLVFKTYEQGRESFQASKVDLVLLDEEPPLAIYTEALTRTLSTVPGQPNGRVMAAFTPLKGISGTVLRFLPGGAYPATEELRKAAWGW